MTLRIVARGIWLYGGTVETPVDIISLDYDWGYEFDRADGRLEPDQVPEQMGAEGVLYYGRFRFALDATEPTSPDTPGYRTIDEAMGHAERKVVGGIRWSAQQLA
jgi:hypothetical protein